MPNSFAKKQQHDYKQRTTCQATDGHNLSAWYMKEGGLLVLEITPQALQSTELGLAANNKGTSSTSHVKLSSFTSSSSLQVKKEGGLLVVGINSHESKRTELQLKGRAVRQGDPRTNFHNLWCTILLPDQERLLSYNNYIYNLLFYRWRRKVYCWW